MTEEEGEKRVQLYLPVALWRALRDRAEAQGVSRNAAIVDAIRDKLAGK